MCQQAEGFLVVPSGPKLLAITVPSGSEMCVSEMCVSASLIVCYWRDVFLCVVGPTHVYVYLCVCV